MTFRQPLIHNVFICIQIMSFKDKSGDITRTTFVLTINSDVGELAKVLSIMKVGQFGMYSR